MGDAAGRPEGEVDADSDTDADVDADAVDRPEDAWSVARLNREISTVIEEAQDRGRFARYVVGEVADVSDYGYGSFFTLCDVETEDSVSCIAWASARESFEADLAEGTECVVRADVDFYAERGDCQLVVDGYWPLGESDRRRDLEALRAALAEEGLFDEDRKRPLPAFPDCIGVVTSLSGSAREDVCSAIHDRSPRTDVKIHGASVQGDDAVPSLIAGLQALEADPEVDVIVVTRGGGGDEALWCFDAEPLVRALADSSKPTVVAVGHEDDETLLEEVADRRAMTPTDAGVAAMPDLSVVQERVDTIGDRVAAAYRAVVETRLERLATRLDGALDSLVAEREQRRLKRRALRQRAADLEGRIDHAYRGLAYDRLERFETRLDEVVRELEHEFEREAAATAAATGRVADLEARIDTAYRRQVERRIDGLEIRIDRAYDGYESRRRARRQQRAVRALQAAVVVLVVLLLGVLALLLL